MSKAYFSRQIRLIGEQGARRLAEAHVAVFGIGGVGGYVTEALARAGVGAITLVDSDDVDETNINRQIIALESTIGMPKVDVMQTRVRQINPDCTVAAKKVFVDAGNIGTLLAGITYAVDAVDTVSAKLVIIAACKQSGVPVISAMGAGNKLAGRFDVKDIYETTNDPLARVVRRELRKRDIKSLKVVSADEKGICTLVEGEPMPSISYMPGICGLTIAGEVTKDMIGWKQ